ncbi:MULTISPECIES: SDR family NAD(P)-dependent oxidoreductase [unclassified Chelatococcus]|uniref:SDR family NAD(P)-dependent oxidoreductase n=1 Tax=unclassified Chelatococcus TaxID=2638111 RepID=UPI001BCE443F|nr:MULTISPECIES: SDR family NAD(P)-dependent oxidoreductase [unclassified Chelatococcus]MBS7701379.1 SDR family NAD(P)-dependent oxidoreductase [Chelatococcus sp. YT9]MBX3557459.1 SDR family NAD(P)-dependent oxidoreductase [Chelatococcus sp.]
MTIRFDGRTALVTGAGNGLGRHYALLLASLGANVVVNDLGTGLDGSTSGDSPADRVVEEIHAAGGQAVANGDSVTDPAGARRMVDQAVAAFGGLDILVCNAGILRDRSLLKMTDEDFRAVMDIHMMGSFFCARAAAAVMVERGYGRIVLTTSPSGLYGNFGQSNYAAAKMALVGFANAVKLELGRKGVLINCLAPSATTRMTEALLDSETAEAMKPEYVAPMVAYLCSEACSESGGIFTAGARHFAINRMVHGRGVTFGEGTPDVDDIATRIDEIVSLDGAQAFPSIGEQTARLMDAYRVAKTGMRQ